MLYFTTNDPFGCLIIVRKDGDGRYSSFAENLESSDYQAYLAWLAEGNTAEPWNPEE